MALILDDIKYFQKVAQTLNLTRASEQIGISQPALSYAIKRLESELGSDLFIRLKNGMQLTKLGESFLVSSNKLIFEWESLQGLIDPDSDEVLGDYTFAIHPSVALYSLHHIMPKLTKKFPKLNFHFIHGLSREMVEKVISWEADFSLAVNPIPHPDLVIKELWKDKVELYGTKNSKNTIIYDPSLTQSQAILKKLNRKDFDNHGLINTKNLELIAKFTSLGLGYGLLPGTVAKGYKGLKPLANSPSYNDRICLVYRPEKQKSTVSKEIIKIISQIMI